MLDKSCGKFFHRIHPLERRKRTCNLLVFEDAFLPFMLSISRFAFAIKIAFYFFPSPQFTAKQSKKNILFCIFSLFSVSVRVGVLAYFPSRQNLFTDIHRESVNFSGKMRPKLLLFGINFNLHAWTLKYLCCETEIIKNYLWICMRALYLFFMVSFASVLCVCGVGKLIHHCFKIWVRVHLTVQLRAVLRKRTDKNKNHSWWFHARKKKS